MESEAGSWPWPRSVHGEMVRGIARQHPAAIVFDILFSEQDKYRPESDRQFNSALDTDSKIYFPMVRRDKEADANDPQMAEVAPMLGLLRTPQAEESARIAVLPPLAIAPRYWRTGTINFSRDADGVGRRYHLYPSAHGWLIPSLPARVAADLGYRPPEQQDIILAWRGKKGSFRHISYADLYEDFGRKHPQRPQDELSGKIVIIGTAATGLHDLRVTPMGADYPGVEMLATALDNLKNHRMMHAAPQWVSPLLTFALLGVLALLLLNRRLCAAHRHPACRGHGAGAGRQLYRSRPVLPAVGAVPRCCWPGAIIFPAPCWNTCASGANARRPCASSAASSIRMSCAKSWRTGGCPGPARAVRSPFCSPTYAASPRCPKSAPRRKSSHCSTATSRCRWRWSSATAARLDKFIGDCIMAFWGAPLDDPDHAKHAVAAALEMGDVLLRFRQELGEQDAEFDVGIGIHSGPAVVGLIGSDQRHEYTAIGDTVNLGSRIEGLTKGISRILVSRETRDLCGDAFDFIPHGSFKVKGRDQEVELFEPRRKENK